MPQIKIKNYSAECKRTTKKKERIIKSNGSCGGMQACNPAFMFVIKTAVLVYIVCIIYIIFYIIYRIVRLAYDSLYDYPNDVVRPGIYLFDGVLNILCYAAVIIISFLTGIFLMLYIVYLVFRAIGFGWLIAILSPWCECIAVGLFSFFDALVVIFFAPTMIDDKIVRTYNTTTTFFDYFFKIVISMTLNENYFLNNEYLNAFRQLFNYNTCDLQLCPEKVDEFTKVITEQSPILFRIVVKDEPDTNLNQMQVIEINNCISKNTTQSPTDASTVDKLTNMFSNEIAKRKCYEEFAPFMKTYDDGSERQCKDEKGNKAPCFSWNQFSTDTMKSQGNKAVSDHEKEKEEEKKNSANTSSSDTTKKQEAPSSDTTKKQEAPVQQKTNSEDQENIQDVFSEPVVEEPEVTPQEYL